MANNYVETAFSISVSAAEAALMTECFEVSDMLGAGFPEEIDHDAYLCRSDAFRSAFPPKPEEEDPFASFYDLFDDPDFPSFDCRLECSPEPFADEGTEPKVNCYIAGEQIDTHATASLIQKVCLSALPFGFQWAAYCDRQRPDEFGGGFYLVTPTEIHGGSTHWLLQEAVAGLSMPPASNSDLS